jgi:hypothetical protein
MPLIADTTAAQPSSRGPVAESTPRVDGATFRAALGKAERVQVGMEVSGLVRPQRTPLSGGQAAQALREAWVHVVGEEPRAETLAIVTAQWAHETGRGASMLNFNFGGIKGRSPSGLGAAYLTREGWGASERRLVDTFRAYTTAGEGARDYVSLLKRRYPDAVEAAREGDPGGFVRALKERGYFTGNEAAYTRSVTALARSALTNGFDAIGGAEGAAESLPSDYQPPGDWSLREAPARAPESIAMNDARFHAAFHVDAAALADEVARASLHLTSRRRDDSDDDRSKA